MPGFNYGVPMYGLTAMSNPLMLLQMQQQMMKASVAGGNQDGGYPQMDMTTCLQLMQQQQVTYGCG